MDVFDEHVYGDTSALPPSMPHTGSTIAEGDYGKLVALLGKAFDGTAQRGSTLPIFYGEYGVETAIPADKAHALHRHGDAEDRRRGDAGAATTREAFRLALCQPNVIGIMVFHVVDESALGAWQSGPFYADGTPKSSVAGDPRRRARRARRQRRDVPRPHRRRRSRSRRRAASSRPRASDGVGVGKVSLFVNGRLAGVKYAAPYTFAWAPARRGRYPLEVRAADAAGNVGRKSLTVAAAHARRGAARDAVGLGLHASAAETRSIASAADAAPSRSTRGSAPVKSMTVDGVPGSSPASTTAATLLENLGRNVRDAPRLRPAGQVRARRDDAADVREDPVRRVGQLRHAHADRVRVVAR